MSRKGLQLRNIDDDALLNYLRGDYFAWRNDIVLRYFTEESDIQAAWNQHKAVILSEWIETHPGTRPCCWWLYDAPREHEVAGIKYAMRRQVSGPPLDLTNILPHCCCGIPVLHAKDIEFESETKFLQRHNLLTAEETCYSSDR